MPGHPAASLGEALIRANAGDRAGATAIVDSVIAKTPNLVEAWHLKGDIAAMQGQNENAIAAYRKSLEIAPDQLLAHVRIVSILLQQGKTQEASAQLEEMKKVAPKHPQTLYLQALLAFQEKNYVAAREAIQHQLRAMPDNVAGLVLAGSIDYQLGAYAQAEAALQKVLLAGAEAAARADDAGQHVPSQRPADQGAGRDEAARWRRRADNGDVLALAGEVYMQNGYTAEAAKVFAKAAALDPKRHEQAHGARAHASAIGRSRAGYRELEAGRGRRSRHPRGPRAHRHALAAAQVRRGAQGDRRAREEAARQAAAARLCAALSTPARTTSPARGRASSARSQLDAHRLRLRGEPRAARPRRQEAGRRDGSASKRVLAKDPKNVRALLALAELRAQTGGTTDEVAALIGKAVSADPTSVVPRLALITFYLRSKEPKKAVAAAQDALAAMPDRAELLDAAGQAQHGRRRHQSGGRLVHQARGRAARHARALHAHGGAQMAAKDADGAVQSLKKALAIKPDLVDVQRAMIKVTPRCRARRTKRWRWRAKSRSSGPKESCGYFSRATSIRRRRPGPRPSPRTAPGLKTVGTTDLAVRLDAALRASGNVAEADKSLAAWLKDHPKIAISACTSRNRRSARRTMRGRGRPLQGSARSQGRTMRWRSTTSRRSRASSRTRRRSSTRRKRTSSRPTTRRSSTPTGMLLVEKGDSKRGVEYVQRAAELAPAANGIRLNLARALIKDGQKPAAKKELETLAKLGDSFLGAGRGHEADAGPVTAMRLPHRMRSTWAACRPLERREREQYDYRCCRGPGLRRTAARRRVRQDAPDDRIRPVEGESRRATAGTSIRRAKCRPTSCAPRSMLEVGTDPAALAEADFIIVAVPTPVDEAHQPDFRPLLGASQAVGKHMKRGATVVYESTVYPGATEEICIPVLEKHSGMSGARTSTSATRRSASIPGDKERTLDQDHQGRLGRHARDARARRARCTAAS